MKLFNNSILIKDLLICDDLGLKQENKVMKVFFLVFGMTKIIKSTASVLNEKDNQIVKRDNKKENLN